MEFDATMDDLLDQELMLLDNMSQVVGEMGHQHLANVVAAVSDMVSLRLTRNLRLMEQHMGCRIALRLDESGMVDGARLDFSAQAADGAGPEAESGPGSGKDAGGPADPDRTGWSKKQ
jgi:hypothetical protein